MTVSVHLGSLFEGGTDLTVLPCSAKGTVGPTTATYLERLNIPGPTSLHTVPRLGEVSAPIPFAGNPGITRYVSFAASVLNNASSEEIIERIGRAIGKLCAGTPNIRRVELPLLGTGSGGLGTEVSAASLQRGFQDFAPVAAVMRIVVKDRQRQDIVNQILSRVPADRLFADGSDPFAEETDREVFINCPFDVEYGEMFRAMLFAVIDCGYSPVTALDVSDASEARINKLYSIIARCRLGIHDLSRVELDAISGLPRFNMPLELGIFLGAKFLGSEEQRRKTCLVLDEQPYRYQKYVSDVSGQDIKSHKGDPKLLANCVRNWLASIAPHSTPSGGVIWDHYQTFLGELKHQCERAQQRINELTHGDLLRHMRAFRKSYKEELEIDGEHKINSPKPQQVRAAIRQVHDKPDSFLTLSKGANGYSYIQAILDQPNKWTLEYQDGHLDRHFQAESSVAVEAVVNAFLNYLTGEEEWRTAHIWIRVDL